MSQIFRAIYENGALRPLEPLDPKPEEGQTLRLRVLFVEDETDEATQRAILEGVLTLPPGNSDVEPLSEEARLEVAERLGKMMGDKPISQTIIEGRGEWPPE